MAEEEEIFDPCEFAKQNRDAIHKVHPLTMIHEMKFIIKSKTIDGQKLAHNMKLYGCSIGFDMTNCMMVKPVSFDKGVFSSLLDRLHDEGKPVFVELVKMVKGLMGGCP